VEKSRDVHAGALARAFDGTAPQGEALPGESSIFALARRIIDDDRALLPVADRAGKVTGALDRQEALRVLFGSGP
jgi:glycine betaine/proline transport system ATP-binding protein